MIFQPKPALAGSLGESEKRESSGQSQHRIGDDGHFLIPCIRLVLLRIAGAGLAIPRSCATNESSSRLSVAAHCRSSGFFDQFHANGVPVFVRGTNLGGH
jgi:hypothetical protein